MELDFDIFVPNFFYTSRTYPQYGTTVEKGFPVGTSSQFQTVCKGNTLVGNDKVIRMILSCEDGFSRTALFY